MSMWSRALQQAGVAADEVDWDVVYAEQLPRVYNFFRYRVGAGPLAEDLTATTFEKAWVGRARYRRDRGAFSTWLFTIAQHVAVDHFRARRSDLPLDDYHGQPAGEPVDAMVERQTDFVRLSALFARLTDREREIVALKYGATLTNREIAPLIGLSESNVGTILSRVTQRLRLAWENE